MIGQFIMSVFLGLIPEVLYFTMFLIYAKDIKEKKLKLFCLISTAYVICMFIQKYKIIYYILFVLLIYLILKLLYKDKAQIIDIFVFSIASIYLTFLSYIFFYILNGTFKNHLTLYYCLYMLDRVMIFIPFIFRNKFNIVYRKYCSLWNRDDTIKKPIKSITLRNLSLIAINISIFLGNIYLLLIIK